MIAKYCALFSSKGYAIGQKFAEWMEAELAAASDEVDQLEGELLGHLEDVQVNTYATNTCPNTYVVTSVTMYSSDS